MNARVRPYLVVLVAALTALSVRAYLPIWSGGPTTPTPNTWPSGASVNYAVNDQVGTQVIFQAGSLVVPAIDTAVARLGVLSGLTFINQGQTPITDPAQDGTNLLTWADTPANQALLGGGLGITTVWFTNGVITEFDVVGNGSPNSPAPGQGFFFSTLGTPGWFDVDGFVMHEAGHGIGMDHSALFNASMYPFQFAGTLKTRLPAADDDAGVGAIYAQNTGTGSVAGTVQRTGGGTVAGAHVFLVDAVTGRTRQGGFTIGAGTFTIDGIAPGIYRVYVEPVDGPFGPANFSAAWWNGVTIDNTFQTAALGGVASPTVLKVAAGATNSVGTINVNGPAPTRNMVQVFYLSTPTPLVNPVSTLEQPAPYAAWFGIFGTGVDQGPDSAFTFLGPFPDITGPSTWATSNPGFDDRIFPLSIPAETPSGSYVLQWDDPTTGELVVFPGCLEVLPPATPRAYTAPYGPGCPGSTGPVTLTGTGTPSLGNAAFSVTLAGQLGGQLAYFVLCALPDHLQVGPGCFASVDWMTSFFDLTAIALPTGGGGMLTVPFPVPNDPALAGTDIYAQVLVSDPMTPAGYALSNALALHFE
ncbi:MAG: hypothetical protein CMJ83_22095 [Planctomycetes bacterium]|nr:hypothetical protein [Planctomycetota bacterium]